MVQSTVEPAIGTAIVGKDERELTEPVQVSKQVMVQILERMGQSLTATLGDWCEVVVHDLADLEHSIVSISGNVTGRKVEGPMTDLGLFKLRAGETEPLLNYTSYTDDGKTLKCSSIFIHDENGKPFACVCVNLNVTPALLFNRFLQDLTSQGQEADITETFSEDLGQTLEAIIAQAADEAGEQLSLMSKDDRLRMVSALERRGVFQLRHSVPMVAKRLGVSRKTIYNYLTELEARREEDRQDEPVSCVEVPPSDSTDV